MKYRVRFEIDEEVEADCYWSVGIFPPFVH